MPASFALSVPSALASTNVVYEVYRITSCSAFFQLIYLLTLAPVPRMPGSPTILAIPRKAYIHEELHRSKEPSDRQVIEIF